jgi:squalene-hopene/tetraprenyl-beta-curcumene cyclase
MCRLILVFLFLSCAAESASYATRNSPEEPLAAAFSSANARRFLEQSVQHWQEKRKCVTCHTNGAYLVTGAAVSAESAVLQESQTFSRAYLSGYISGSVKPKRQHGAIEGLVSTTSYLAISEMTTGGKLSLETAAALDYIWTKQSAAGAWEDWLKCHWGPFEVDDHFGVSLATVALAMAPEAYRQQPNAKEAATRMHHYLQTTTPSSAHQKGMLLWAGRYAPGLISTEQRQQWLRDLRALQHADGGWALIHLGDEQWKREDGNAQFKGSDGYATGFLLFALRQAGVSTEDQAIRSGVAWLKANQRQSGRWFTWSPRRDGKHYITQAATNMALLALAECGAL